MLRSNLLSFLLLTFSMHVFSTVAFDVEECPSECHCSLDGVLMLVDCSGLGLTELPEFPDNQIHMLDLSSNQFTAIPSQLETFLFLQYLDMSENNISRLKATSLKGLTMLRLLNLSRNNISSWSAINPGKIFEPAQRLVELSLAENPLTSFTANDENLILISSSLKLLDLSHCKITKVTGQQVLQGMKALKHLNLAGNQIRSVTDLISDTLFSLDLSHNRLTNLLPNMLENLPELTYLDLSRNHRLSLQSKQGEYVTSSSLKKIDLSYCNMDNIELEGFPALTSAILSANMIRELTKESFINTKVLENLDLSQNSISIIDVNAFKKLKHLKTLNLSFNMIGKIQRETFKDNELLTKLDLGRNSISRFNRFAVPNLTHLNMTWCQIMNVDPDAIFEMPELIDLDLSNNLINDIPDSLNSENLQSLDLSMNRMTSIRNMTFWGLPEIAKINLAGNRFTIPFKRDFFAENLYLSELRLGDNPWLCSCHDMHSFYIYLTDPPAKLWEKQSLRCQSPEEVAGRTWESACYFTWYPQAQMGTTEKVWTFLMVTIIAFSGCMCLIMSIKRGIEGRRQTAREEERERNLEEGREIIRQNRLRMQQEAQRDAPDPRESRPPCYSDAILMPRLDGSFASLDELGGGRLKHKRRRQKTEEADDIEEEVPLRRNRCRSEEVVSMRVIVATNTVQSSLDPGTHGEGEESHSTAILTLDHSPGPSSRARLPPPQVPSQPAIENLGEIKNFNQSSCTTIDRSPYAKRKMSQRGTIEAEQNNEIASLPPNPSNKSFEILEDHFQANRKSSSSGSGDSSEFITINAPLKDQSTSSSNEDGLVIISRPTSF